VISVLESLVCTESSSSRTCTESCIYAMVLTAGSVQVLACETTLVRIKTIVRREIPRHVGVKLVGNVCSVRTFVVVHVTRNEWLLTFGARITLEVVA
jgi:hypothetical protein